MSKISNVLLLFSLFLLVSCGPNPSKLSQDAEGFAKLQEVFVDKFGADAYYTNISIVFVPGKSAGSGLMFNVVETTDPSSHKMQEWAYNSHSGWQNTAEVTLEIEGDTDPKEFMFQLDDTFNLRKVGELIEKSSKKLAEEKNITNAVLNTAWMDAPDNGDFSTMKIAITMKPENGGTTFNFYYTLDGELEDFTY